MSLGTWDPNLQTTNATTIDSTLLHRFITMSNNSQLEQLSELLSDEEKQQHASLMKQEQANWQQVAESFNNQQLEDLMRFFTVAEKIPGWEAAEKSPVIWLGKILKQRGVGINRDLAIWIKQHSNNQYLPHGPLM